MKLDLKRLDEHGRLALDAVNARTARDLVPSAPPRALGIGAPAQLPYSNGRTWMVPIVVEPGPLRVSTQLGISFSATLDDRGAIQLAPVERAHLVAAMQLIVDGEEAALAAAAAALDQAGIQRPARTWADALQVARIDPRQPPEQLPGAPTWSFMFEPYNEATGWTFALVDARTFVVQIAR